MCEFLYTKIMFQLVRFRFLDRIHICQFVSVSLLSLLLPSFSILLVEVKTCYPSLKMFTASSNTLILPSSCWFVHISKPNKRSRMLKLLMLSFSSYQFVLLVEFKLSYSSKIVNPSSISSYKLPAGLFTSWSWIKRRILKPLMLLFYSHNFVILAKFKHVFPIYNNQCISYLFL